MQAAVRQGLGAGVGVEFSFPAEDIGGLLQDFSKDGGTMGDYRWPGRLYRGVTAIFILKSTGVHTQLIGHLVKDLVAAEAGSAYPIPSGKARVRGTLVVMGGAG